MASNFKWRLCSYVGGDYAVHPNYKPYQILRLPPTDWAAGEITIGARDTADIEISGLGFKPTLLMLVSYRPRSANGGTDTSFGNRGGGYSFGVAGLAAWGEPWDSGTTYDPGDTAELSGVHYYATLTNTNDPPPSANWALVESRQFTGTTRIRQGFDINGMKRWREDRCFHVVHGGTHGYSTEADIALILDHTFDADGFTLTVEKNLYDQSDPLFWLAMAGNFTVGVMDAGTTSISGFNGTPKGAVFLSSKAKLTDLPYDYTKWDHMQGFASLDGQACVWGGCKHASWDWSTERWHDADSIVLCQGAQGSSFTGTVIEAVGRVTDWHSGGIDLQWSVFNLQPYRIGWILAGPDCETGYLEANFTKAGIDQIQPTRIRPDVILMTTTNYNFSMSEHNPLLLPRSPNEFQKGGGGGFGWHRRTFTSEQGDAWGVHTYGNSVQERGHYSNSATQVHRGCIQPGAGANSSPPAQHQHGINVLPNPVIVGTNYRYAERHASVKRIHVNESDFYIP